MLRRRDNSRGRWHVLNALEMSIFVDDLHVLGRPLDQVAALPAVSRSTTLPTSILKRLHSQSTTMSVVGRDEQAIR